MAKRKIRIHIEQTTQDVARSMRSLNREEALANGISHRSCVFDNKRAYNRRRSKAELRAMGQG